MLYFLTVHRYTNPPVPTQYNTRETQQVVVRIDLPPAGPAPVAYPPTSTSKSLVATLKYSPDFTAVSKCDKINMKIIALPEFDVC